MTEPHSPNTPIPRDARLDAALHHMPDAQMQASPATRVAVLRAAQEAVQPATVSAQEPSWWRKLFASPKQRMPWRATFATVLIAGFVTLLWRGYEPPDAQRDAGPLREEMAAEKAASAPAATSVPLPAAVPAPVPKGTAPASPESKQKVRPPAAPTTPSKADAAVESLKESRLEAHPGVAKVQRKDAAEATTAADSAMQPAPAMPMLAPRDATPSKPAPAPAPAPVAANVAPAPAAMQSDGSDALNLQRSKSAAAPGAAPLARTSITINGVQRSASAAQVAQLQTLLEQLVYEKDAEPLLNTTYQLRIKQVDYRISPDAVQRQTGSSAAQSSTLTAAQFAQIQRLLAVWVEN